MAKLYSRGRYWYVTYCVNGRQVRRSLGKDRKIAELSLKQIELDIARGDGVVFEKKTPLDGFLGDFMARAQSSLKPRSKARYGAAVKHFQGFFQGTRNLSDISPGELERYKSNRLAIAHPSTVNWELTMLRGMFNLAVKWGLLKNNPAKHVSLIKEQTRRRLPRYFTAQEIQTILADCSSACRDIFLVLLHTGLRRDELRYLTVGDINLVEGTITIQAKPGFSPKTDERVIPIHPDIVEVLTAHCAGRQPQEYIFGRKGKVADHKLWLRELHRVCARNGIKKATLHTFRHSFASHLIMNGAALVAVKELLGHENIETTMIYAHVSPDHLRKSVPLLNFKTG